MSGKDTNENRSAQQIGADAKALEEEDKRQNREASVIVAHDTADTRQYLQSLLAPHCAVVEVPDGAAALRAARRRRPDLVLSNIMMPGMDGFELLHEVRNDASLRSVPVILLSARAGEEGRIEGIEAGADACLAAPFCARELVAVVTTHLKLHVIRSDATEALQKSLEREKLVSDIVEGIRSETDLNSVLQRMVEALGRYAKADRCNIWLFDSKEKQFLVPQNEFRISDEIKKIKGTILPNIPVVAFGLSHRKTTHIPDITKLEGLTDEDRRMIADRGIKGLLHVPILHHGILVGLLRIHSTDRIREWDAETIRVVEQVAAHAAIAIHKASLIQDLKESDARKTGILESSLDAIISMDHQGNVVDWNAAASQLFGYKSEEAIGRSMAELIIPERFRKMHHNGLARYMETGKGAVINRLIETSAMRSDGTEFVSELTISPVPREGPPLFTGVLRDITRRKRAEQALKESEDRFRTLANNINSLAWIADEGGSIFWFSQRWFNYTGMTPEEMQQSGWIYVLHPDHVDRVTNFVDKAWKGAQPWEITVLLRGADDNYRWFLTRANPIMHAEGGVVQWIGATTDIHDQKMALEKKDEFMSIASHELKTPITSVKASLQILNVMLEEKRFDAMQSFLSRAETNVDKLTVLVSDLLDVSRIRAGKLQFNYSEFAIREVIDDCVEHFKHQDSKHRIIIQTERDVRVRADKARLEQVFLNLLSNAIKYSPKADQVILSATEEDGRLKIAVKDFGIGIAKEKQALVFDRFYRAQEALHHFQGLGLGLYISCEIVERHGGRIWVESEEGKGSTFYFDIPNNPHNTGDHDESFTTID